ncbi:hypothetical protein [Chryseobacterium polytrichastri]|uniref:Lipoprotein n=1 Tax=Chryseobacterium polytrichastri TaxID=1302687 RepID=A0A1M6ZU58_9FLAO|nr:hypothetical protein [Chryseobacterium polytrichastri]SHL33853.1 hypothetical protein SAMN05444267_101636 [Chryseobacterium polytrichastri]
MQKNLYLIILSFSLISCYTYQVKKQADIPADNKKESKKSPTLANDTSTQLKSSTAESQGLKPQPMPIPINVQEKLVPNKKFKIDVDGKSYKIIVDKWERDSLVAHPINNPKRILKFHKNQINGEKIAEKRFSQPIADIITVAAYTGIGVLIWYLLR